MHVAKWEKGRWIGVRRRVYILSSNPIHFLFCTKKFATTAFLSIHGSIESNGAQLR